nr:glycoside hydrolase family 32 protein [Pedobacter panaciterrae]
MKNVNLRTRLQCRSLLQRTFRLVGTLIVLLTITTAVKATDIQIKIEKQYLNIPIGNQARLKLFKINIDGKSQREFPAQLAEDSVDYWIFIDVTEFKGKTIVLSCPATEKALSRIYQDDNIHGSENLYSETYRPQFHLTPKRGWSNDINGPIYFNNTYHLFWQAFPFGKSWNTGYMYWGHATSKDMLHWTEHPTALMLDSLGSPWSGTAVIDKNNDSGFGKDAMVLYYTAYDLTSFKQVQCIAYSTDEGKTFKRYDGNPIIDSNWEMKSNDTRDPKVFYFEPGKVWVMVLFERDGMSFYNSKDMKNWKKESHFKGLHECPDFFELPVDGDSGNKKWVLHGGSADYFIGSFDGKTFQAEGPKMRYAEGISNQDMLYAAESFENMPNDRRVQIAWGRANHPNMPFTQMMLFPTDFSLKTTKKGLKLVANPIKEIETLHATSKKWTAVNLSTANEKLSSFKTGLYHIKARFTIAKNDTLRINYGGNEILKFSATDFNEGENTIEILIDRTTSEIFVNGGERYIVENFSKYTGEGLTFKDAQNTVRISQLELHTMKSIWNKSNQ